MNKLFINAGLLLSVITGLTSCNKTDYLDINASERPALAAYVRFVNARTTATPVQFWTFTNQITTTGLAPGSTSAYLPTVFGNVQINLTEGTGTSYKVSQQFGNSATFTSSGGPNGPIADFYHTVFATRKNRASGDSLILFYDNLTVPATGKAKLRFVNLSPDQGPVTVMGSDVTFTNVAYGRAANSAISGETLSAYTLGPFVEVTAGTKTLTISTAGGVLTSSSYAFQDGKIYTLFTQGSPGAVKVISILHN